MARVLDNPSWVRRIGLMMKMVFTAPTVVPCDIIRSVLEARGRLASHATLPRSHVLLIVSAMG